MPLTVPHPQVNSRYLLAKVFGFAMLRIVLFLGAEKGKVIPGKIIGQDIKRSMNLSIQVRAIFICIEAHLFTICIYLAEECPHEGCKTRESKDGPAVYKGRDALRNLKDHMGKKHKGEAPPAWWTEKKEREAQERKAQKALE